LTSDTFAIQTLTLNGFFPVITSVVLLVGMLGVMLRLDWVLTLIALAVVPLLFGAIVLLSRRITVLATDARIKESAVWAIAQRTIGAIRVIQAFTTEEEEHRRFVATSGASLAANLRLYTSQTVYTAFVDVVVAAGTAAVLWFGVTHVLAGEVVAIVGATGAGKTTLVSLVTRFYDPTAGRVLFDGIDVRDFQLKALRQQVAMVLQPPLVFPTTVRDNIAYGRQDATASAIEGAAHVAQLDDFLERLPEGLDTVVGEAGATLSAGEQLRITIARAVLRDAPILILDEPTSALDATTEARVMQGLEALMAGRTTFVIAHRLSTVRRADVILVLDAGRIVEQGTFTELVARGGHFARLHRTQFGGE